MKRENRKKSDIIYLLISIFGGILGVEEYLYFKLKLWEFSHVVSNIFGEKVDVYSLTYGILTLTYLLGAIYAIIAILKMSKKKLAIFIMLLNISGILINGMFCGKLIYEKNSISEGDAQKNNEQLAEIAETEKEDDETTGNESVSIESDKKEENIHDDWAESSVNELEEQDDEEIEDDQQQIIYAEIIVKDYGNIEVELDAGVAPITVKNFIKLARSGFYDKLTFWRVINGFIIQGGDPKKDGTGGSKDKIKGEFSNNGVENNISHMRGTISMARASDPNSASSQFFIVQSDSTFLDGDYAAFGHVIKGMDIVDEICQEAQPVDENGTIAEDEQPIIESIKIKK